MCRFFRKLFLRLRRRRQLQRQRQQRSTSLSNVLHNNTHTQLFWLSDTNDTYFRNNILDNDIIEIMNFQDITKQLIQNYFSHLDND